MAEAIILLDLVNIIREKAVNIKEEKILVSIKIKIKMVCYFTCVLGTRVKEQTAPFN